MALYDFSAPAVARRPRQARFASFSGASFGGAWEDWCDQAYADPAVVVRCKQPGVFPPWTDLGRIQRAIPFSDSKEAQRIANEAAALAKEQARIAAEEARNVANWAKGGEWGKWCNETYGDQSPNGINYPLLEKCNWNGIPCTLTPPWTEVGAGCRGLPKESWLTSLIGAVRVPDVKEYDPENLITLPIVDPARYAVLNGYISYFGSFFGAGYMQQFVFPYAMVTGLPLAVGLSVGRGGWDRVWDRIIKPFIDHEVGLAELLLDYCLTGNSALARHAIKQASKRVTGMQKAVLLAIVDSTGTFIDSIRDPARFKDTGTIAQLGEALQRVSALADPNSRGVVKVAGEALVSFAPALSALLKGAGLAVALDEACVPVFGIKFSMLKQVGADSRAALTANPKADGLEALRIIRQVVADVAAAMQQIKINGLADGLVQLFSDVDSMVSQILGMTPAGAGTAGAAVVAPAVVIPDTHAASPVGPSSAIVSIPRTSAAIDARVSASVGASVGRPGVVAPTTQMVVTTMPAPPKRTASLPTPASTYAPPPVSVPPPGSGGGVAAPNASVAPKAGGGVTLGVAAAGGAAGFVVGGPPGAAIGALVGAALAALRPK